MKAFNLSVIAFLMVILSSCSGPSGGDADIAKKLDQETPEVLAKSELLSLAQEVNALPQYSLTQSDFDALKSEDGLLTDEELKEIEAMTSEGGAQ